MLVWARLSVEPPASARQRSLEITVMVTCGSAVMALQLQIPRFFAKEVALSGVLGLLAVEHKMMVL